MGTVTTHEEFQARRCIKCTALGRIFRPYGLCQEALDRQAMAAPYTPMAGPRGPDTYDRASAHAAFIKSMTEGEPHVTTSLRRLFGGFRYLFKSSVRDNRRN